MGKKKSSIDKRQDKRISTLEKFVKKTVENKQVNFINSLNATATVSVTDLSLLLNQGVTDGGDINIVGAQEARIGNSVTLMEQHFKFSAHLPLAVPDTNNSLRVIIVESADGNQPLAYRDVINYANAVVYSAEQLMLSGYTTKTTTNRRYRVLMDKRITLSQFGKPYINWSFRKKYKNGKVIEFNDDLSSSPTSWKQQMFLISDSTLPGHPILDYYYRFTFKDA